jgi:hypothetical protein
MMTKFQEEWRVRLRDAFQIDSEMRDGAAVYYVKFRAVRISEHASFREAYEELMKVSAT